MKVVNLFGGPSTGKSTIAAGVYSKLKKRHIGIELVREYAKELYYMDRLQTSMEFQELIYAEQNVRLQSLLDRDIQFAITDSPILLSAVYPDINRELYNTKKWPALHEFKTLVRAQFNFYDNINIWLERPEGVYEKEGRLQDEQQAKWIDEMILSELEGRPYTALKVNEEVELDIISLMMSATINT